MTNKTKILFDKNIEKYSIDQIENLEKILLKLKHKKGSNHYEETQVHNLHQAFILIHTAITHLRKTDKSNVLVKDQIKILNKIMKVLKNECNRF